MVLEEGLIVGLGGLVGLMVVALGGLMVVEWDDLLVDLEVGGLRKEESEISLREEEDLRKPVEDLEDSKVDLEGGLEELGDDNSPKLFFGISLDFFIN